MFPTWQGAIAASFQSSCRSRDVIVEMANSQKSWKRSLFSSFLTLFLWHQDYCKAFHPFHSDFTTAIQGTCSGMATESTAEVRILGTTTRRSFTTAIQGTGMALESTAEVHVLGNWRLVSNDSNDYENQLLERLQWSNEQFEESLDLYERLMNCEDFYVSPGIKTALNTLDHAYRLYGPNSVICSFNGGKDAVAILHLLRAAHANYYNCTGANPSISQPRAVYFKNIDEFPEVTSFLEESVERYDLDMVEFENGIKFSSGLEILVKNNYVKGTKVVSPMAFVLGTRISDPNAVGQNHFSPSSHWMPPFMRVNPVLDWDYGLVWHFLRLFDLPYCSLYDQGYTSLGTIKDTLPCPALAVNRGEIDHGADKNIIPKNNNLPKFWPAYMLRDWDQERAGRLPKKSVDDVSDDTQNLNDNDTNEDDLTVDTKSVGILVVGDEILKGMTSDTNTKSAAKALRKQSLKLSRVVIVSDDVNEIATEIRRLRNEVDVLITSGGVGPTHDDVTIKGVAQALDKKLEYNAEMAELLRNKMKVDDTNSTNNDVTSAQRKMAILPSNAKLRYLSTDEWPVLQCRNVFILPGVPQFFEKKIENVAEYLSSQLERSVEYKVVLSVDEQSIVDVLNDAVLKHPNVSIGSYPFVSHPEFKTVVTLEANLVDSTSQEFLIDESSTADTDRLRSRRNSLFIDRDAPILSKEIRDKNVRSALDDLINEFPKGSILRVENEDFDPF